MSHESALSIYGDEREARRLQELLSRELLDTRPEQRFDQFTRLVADVLDTPIAFIAVMDEETQWFKSRVGLDLDRAARDEAFCKYTLVSGDMEIPDTLNDARFRHHRLVRDPPGIRFYAGVPLRGPADEPVGTLCVLDTAPRTLGADGWRRLRAFRGLVEQELRFNARVGEAREAIERTALRDPATGLPRRSVMVELVGRALATARSWREYVAVAHIRFPRYDEVMAVYGRDMVDQLAALFTERLRSVIHAGDHLGRLEEDSFCAVLTGVDSEDDAARRMWQLCQALRQPYKIGGGTREVVVAFGVSLFPDDAEDVDPLLDRARLAAGRAQREEQQSPVFFSGEMNQQVSRRDRIAQQLSRAIDRERIELHYQPILDARSGRLTGCEALARWTCAQLGRVSPGEFIPVAERDPSLSRKLTHYVLEQACRQAAEWRQRLPEPFWIGVNVSGRELHDPALADTVLGLLERFGLPPEALVIELTEQSMISDLEGAIAVMSDLRARGVHCAVDDFGTGYSSLNYLRRLPLSKLKIDRHFIDSLQHSHAGREVVGAIIAIGHALEMSVVAEGVETHDQVQMLSDLHCDELQGFLVRQPVPPAELEAIVEQGACIPWVWEERDRNGP